MKRVALLVTAGLILGALWSGQARDDISPTLETLRIRNQVPSLAAAAVVRDEIVAAGASGLRRRGADARVTLADAYHLGSCTKSMTATLAAVLVREGRIGWRTKVSEVFNEIEIHPGFRNATLRQLLSNTGGCPEAVPRGLWSRLWENRGSASDQRVQLVRGILREAPAYPPGDGHEYSNAGFGIAGAMLESVTGRAFEELMREKLFTPLGMTSAGFRAPATPGEVDQPYGHHPDPVDPEPSGDNPRAIAPAGAVHCSILDFARYVRFHLGHGPRGILGADELRFLHQLVPPSEDYAMGWKVARREWAGGIALTHAGSNTMFYSVMWMAPERDFAAVAQCNTGEAEGFDACDQAVAGLIDQFLKPPAD